MKVINNAQLPELLSPAGSPEALSAAIEAGADAVYFGAELFSNRMRARNFNETELADAVGLCAVHSVKSYITVNTRLRDAELSDAAELVCELYRAGADAFIIADLGLAAELRRRLPSVELHASTQMTGSDSVDTAVMRELGFSRMVCPRELSYDELRELCRHSETELEMFVHGAHCVSVSGQCLMSWAMGGRSGNRGQCAQPCRLPFKIDKAKNASAYPLSLKDMCLAAHVPELLETSVASLKLEGRLKSADYVYGTTLIWRRLLDERRAATREELELLESLFSRGGFTDGYFTSSFADMNGVRAKDAKSVSLPHDAPARRRAIRACLSLEVGHPSVLELSAGDTCVRVEGATVDEAKNAPLDRAALYKSISRLGDGPFSLSDEDFEYIPDATRAPFMPVSRLNALRRDATDALEAAIRAGARRDTAESLITAEANNASPCATDGLPCRTLDVQGLLPLRTASFFSPSSVPDEAADYFDVIFLPQEALFDKAQSVAISTEKLGMALPAWHTDAHLDKTRAALRDFARRGGRFTLAHSLAQIRLSREAGLVPVASERLNITNISAAETLASLGAEYIILSPELPLPALRAISRKSHAAVGATLYGKTALMLLRRCIMSDSACSGKCGREGCLLPRTLSDRRSARLTVLPSGDRTNIILNPCPLWCADTDGIGEMKISHFSFTDESASRCAQVIRAYRLALTPDEAGLSQFKRL